MQIHCQSTPRYVKLLSVFDPQYHEHTARMSRSFHEDPDPDLDIEECANE